MSIRISEKHGVNPSVSLCFYCGKDKGLALLGKMKGDVEAPRQAVYDHIPCEGCEGLMKEGVMLIEVDETKTDDVDNPYRTGCVVVVKDEAIKRIVGDEKLREDILKARMTFMPIDAWDALGIPRENFDNRGEAND